MTDAPDKPEGDIPAKQNITRDKLLSFVPSYRAGYTSSGGRDVDITDQQIVQKMEAAKVWNESLAEQTGRQDGFDARENAKKQGHW